MRVATWNVGCKPGSWDRILEIDADVILLQEAPRPPDGLPGSWVYEEFESRRRSSVTGIWSRTFDLAKLPPTTSKTCEPAIPGAVAVAKATLPRNGILTIFSVHGVDERIDTGLRSPQAE